MNRALRWIVPAALVGGWLLFITSRQVALFPPAGAPPGELLPISLIGGLVAVAAAVRVARPSLASHLVFLAALTFGLALLAAQPGQALANATAAYCGDQCRTAIFARFATFFGWPILAAIVFWAIARSECRVPGESAAERAAWTRSWGGVTLLAGLGFAVVWWQIILPNG